MAWRMAPAAPKVLLASPFFSQHFDSGLFWAKALSNMGHGLVLWDYRVDLRRPVGPFDLVLVMKGEIVRPTELPHPRICYYPDALERSPGIENVLAQYDKVFTSVRPTPPGMEWLPTGFDPMIHRYTGAARDIPSLYIGTNNSPRKWDFINTIWPQVVAGNGWEEPQVVGGVAVRIRPGHPQYNLPPHYLHDFVALASRAQVAIDVHQGPAGLNRKLFELIPCAFTITDRVPGVREILGDITDLVSFATPEEGRMMKDHYIEHPEERARLWKIEKERIASYTYASALVCILEKLSLT